MDTSLLQDLIFQIRTNCMSSSQALKLNKSLDYFKLEGHKRWGGWFSSKRYHLSVVRR